MKSHLLLHDYHDNIARTMTSPDAPFLWVFDLTDPAGFDLAVSAGSDPATLRDRRDATLETECIPSMNVGLGYAASIALLASFGQEAVPSGPHYLAVVSEGYITVRELTAPLALAA